MSTPSTPATELLSIPVKVVGLPGYTDEFDATLILEVTRPTDGVHFSIVEAEWEGKMETIVAPSVCVEKPPSPPTFDLFITTPEGRTSKALRGPYPTREETRRTIRIAVSNGDSHGRVQELSDFAEMVSLTPLGVPVTYGETGLTFRTEYTASRPPKEPTR